MAAQAEGYHSGEQYSQQLNILYESLVASGNFEDAESLKSDIARRGQEVVAEVGALPVAEFTALTSQRPDLS